MCEYDGEIAVMEGCEERLRCLVCGFLSGGMISSSSRLAISSFRC